jgi:outer membrane autotransporter protein
MPVQHTYRPKHLALAIAITVGCAEISLAETLAEPLAATDELITRLDAFISRADIQRTPINKATDWTALKLDERDDLVSVANKGVSKKLADGGDGMNVLQLNAANGGSLADTRNFRMLEVKQGRWTASGAGDFEDGAVVRPGAALINNGSIVGHVFVDEGGIFSGKGTVGSLNVHGQLVVDRSVGAPRVTGDMTLSSAAVLAYELNPDGPGATITVDGTANLDNATLKVVASSGNELRDNPHIIIAAQRVEGSFREVLDDLPLIDFDAKNDGKNVELIYKRNDTPIEELAPDKNSGEFTRANENLAASTTTANAAINALLRSDTETITQALPILAGGSNGNLGKATLNSDAPISASLLSAMRQLDYTGISNSQYGAPRLAAGSDATGRVWLQALGHSGKLSRDFDPLQTSTQGLLLGADWQIDEQWRLGVMSGQSRTRQKSRELDGNLDSWHLGAYALRQNGPMSLRLGATHNAHDGSSARRVEFSGFKDRPKGNYDASTQQAFAEVGYNLGRANTSIEPFASVGYQRYQRDSFTEKGGDASLKVHAQSEENFSSTFGVRLAKLNALDNGMRLTPRFSAGWKHTYGKVYTETRQRLVTGGNDYSVYSAPMDRDKLVVDAGADLRVSARNTLGLGLTGEVGSDSRSHGVMGQWQMTF